MAQANQQELFSFANNFWGDGDDGVSVLLTRFSNVKHTTDELRNFYRERSAIEEEYSRKLVALSRKALGTYEIGTLKQAFDTIRHTTEGMGISHAAAAAQLRVELEDPLADFTDNLRSRRKTIQLLVEKLTKTKQTHKAAVEHAQQLFQSDCNKINGYYTQQGHLMGKELERHNFKLEKAHTAVEFSKRDYQNALRKLAEATDVWAKEWKIACDKLQDLEEERVNFVKSNLWAFTNVISTFCVNDDEGCEKIRLALEKTNVFSDNELFVRANATGSEIIDPPTFVNYLSSPNSTNSNNSNNKNDNSKTFKTAKFPRLSQIGLGALEFNPTASVRASRDRRSNGPSVLAQLQEYNTAPYHQLPDRSNPYQQQSERPNLYQQHPDRSNPYSTNDSALQDIPTLTHPSDSYESQRPSPVQQLGSRQDSLSSDLTSASNQEHDSHGHATNTKNHYAKNNSNVDLHNGRITPSSARLVLPSDNNNHRHAFHEEPHGESSPYNSSNHATSSTNLKSNIGSNNKNQSSHPSPERKPISQMPHQPNNSNINNTNIPNIRPSTAEDPDDDSSKKRTWASPFRRRSRKDLNAAYNSDSSTNRPNSALSQSANNSANVNSVPKNQPSQASFNNNQRSSYGRSSSRPGSAAAGMFPTHSSNPGSRKPAPQDFQNGNSKHRNDPNKASTVLSMGDNLFDLGVHDTSSPYDAARSKSASPTKSFNRDDPLVMAIEKLKATGGSTGADDLSNRQSRNRPNVQQHPYPSNSGPNVDTNMNPKAMSNTSMHSGNNPPRHSQQQQKYSGNTRNSNTGNSNNNGYQNYNQPNNNFSNPALRHQNSGSALAAPGPAFTSNDMQATSDKYSNQTRDMFDQQKQQPRGSDGYYNRSSMDRRTASPNPRTQQQVSQMQRPRTMYDGNFQDIMPQNMSQNNGRGGGNFGGDGRPHHHGGMDKHQRSRSDVVVDQRSGYGNDRYGSSGYRDQRSPSPNPMMMMNNNGRSPSPNPMMMNRGRTPSPNPMMMNNGRSPSPNPTMMNNMRGRTPSPNPMMMSNMRGQTPSPNPNMMMARGRSASPNPAAYGNMRQQYNEYDRYPRSGSSFANYNGHGGGNGNVGNPNNRAVSPNPNTMMMGRSHDSKGGASRYSNNSNNFYDGGNDDGSYNKNSQNMMGNSKSGINPRPSTSSFVSNASAMFNGRPNRGNSMDHRIDPRMTNQQSGDPQLQHHGQMGGGSTNSRPNSSMGRPVSRNNNNHNTGTSPNSNGANNSNNGGRGGGPNNDLPTMARDGRKVIHYVQANFDYRAAIPEEVSFRQGDVLLIVKMLEDGWWEAEVYGEGRMGLAPSNFLSDL